MRKDIKKMPAAVFEKRSLKWDFFVRIFLFERKEKKKQWMEEDADFILTEKTISSLALYVQREREIV